MLKTSLKVLGIFALIVALAGLIWATRTGKLDPRPYPNIGTLAPVVGSTGAPSPAIPVTLGIYVEKIYDLAVQSETVSAEGWAWLIWSQEFQDLLDAQKISLAGLLTGTNLLADSAVTPRSESPVKLPDGRFYQIFSFQGRFSTPVLDFRRFPFQTIRLPLTFGLNLENPSLNAGQVRLVPDRSQSGVGYHIRLPGYVATGQQLNERISTFPTDFGRPLDSPEADSQFSRVQMEITYRTSVVSAFLQLFLPLIVVMSVVLLTPALAGSLWDVRIALPSTALLTLIFLQQGYRAQLPALPYLTFIDQIYAFCYAVSLIIFALCVWSSNHLDQATDANRAEVIDRINRIDRRFQIGLTVGLFVLTCLSWLTPVRYPGY